VSVRHFVILATWTVVALVVTGALLFLFTYGDCFENVECSRYVNRTSSLIGGAGFVVYWAVFIALIRRWNR
jgi:hypothetical protein